MAAVFIANTDFFTKPSGILKICELVLGMIVMSLCAHYSIVGSIHTMLRLSSVFSMNTESRLRQTLFEPLYHLFALILYFSGSVAVLAGPVYWNSGRRDGFMAAGGIGIITSILYGVSTYDSYRGYVTE